MILGDPLQAAGRLAPGGRTTLDEIFIQARRRRPEAVALADASNKEAFTDSAPKRLTYAEADRAISSIAGRLRRLSLPSDSIVGIQLPNTVESVLTLLGVLRAGMIAAPLPLLWRRNDLVHALTRVGAKLLITCGRVGEVGHAELAMHAAAEIFPIRYVCAFGQHLPDGVVPLDGLPAESGEPLPPVDRPGNPAAHLALISWDTCAEGLVPVARSHAEIVAGGLALLLEGRFEQEEIFLSSIPPSSFAGLALTLMPWLLTGGTLHLHQPFDPDALTAQLNDGACTAAILPAQAASLLAQAGCFGAARSLKTMLSLWRSPEGLSGADSWLEKNIKCVDVAAFGEVGFVASLRGSDGKPAPIPFGVITAPRGAAGAVLVSELVHTDHGTLAMRGPMVPHSSFPPRSDHGGLAHFKSIHGLADTGFACRIEPATRTLVVTARPPGIAAVGGYRFPLHELQTLAVGIDRTARIAAVADPLFGQRLAGAAADSKALRAGLAARGINPLAVGAFASEL